MGKEPEFGELLIAALEEAVAFEEGRGSARVDRVEITARDAAVEPPPAFPADRIREVRKELGVSQPVFAQILNVSSSTVRAWEQGARAPEGPSLRLLQVAERNPDALLSNLSSPRKRRTA